MRDQNLKRKAAGRRSKGGIAVTGCYKCFRGLRMGGNAHFQIIYLRLIPMDVT